eukprot:GHVR01006841.1.p1 GENE.GHVR01006841.1~~GHVR01006841.1.p1  ORF type:complete len:112 (+),score=15.97 GHVR01006841.1:178-513(+)
MEERLNCLKLNSGIAREFRAENTRLLSVIDTLRIESRDQKALMKEVGNEYSDTLHHLNYRFTQASMQVTNLNGELEGLRATQRSVLQALSDVVRAHVDARILRRHGHDSVV